MTKVSSLEENGLYGIIPLWCPSPSSTSHISRYSPSQSWQLYKLPIFVLQKSTPVLSLNHYVKQFKWLNDKNEAILYFSNRYIAAENTPALRLMEQLRKFFCSASDTHSLLLRNRCTGVTHLFQGIQRSFFAQFFCRGGRLFSQERQPINEIHESHSIPTFKWKCDSTPTPQGECHHSWSRCYLKATCGYIMDSFWIPCPAIIHVACSRCLL